MARVPGAESENDNIQAGDGLRRVKYEVNLRGISFNRFDGHRPDESCVKTQNGIIY